MRADAASWQADFCDNIAAQIPKFLLTFSQVDDSSSCITHDILP